MQVCAGLCLLAGCCTSLACFLATVRLLHLLHCSCCTSKRRNKVAKTTSTVLFSPGFLALDFFRFLLDFCKRETHLIFQSPILDKRFERTPKATGGDLTCSIESMSVRHMSATQSGGRSSLKEVSQLAYACLWFCLFCLCVCLSKHCWKHIYLQSAAWGRHGKTNGTNMN